MPVMAMDRETAAVLARITDRELLEVEIAEALATERDGINHERNRETDELREQLAEERAESKQTIDKLSDECTAASTAVDKAHVELNLAGVSLSEDLSERVHDLLAVLADHDAEGKSLRATVADLQHKLATSRAEEAACRFAMVLARQDQENARSRHDAMVVTFGEYRDRIRAMNIATMRHAATRVCETARTSTRDGYVLVPRKWIEILRGIILSSAPATDARADTPGAPQPGSSCPTCNDDCLPWVTDGKPCTAAPDSDADGPQCGNCGHGAKLHAEQFNGCMACTCTEMPEEIADAARVGRMADVVDPICAWCNWRLSHHDGKRCPVPSGSGEPIFRTFVEHAATLPLTTTGCHKCGRTTGTFTTDNDGTICAGCR
jgi:hypothetical protein